MMTVRLLRVILGINQQTLCDKSGVSRQALSLYETGRQFPSRRAAADLDRALVAIIDERVVRAVGELKYHPLLDPDGAAAVPPVAAPASNVVPIASAVPQIHGEDGGVKS